MTINVSAPGYEYWTMTLASRYRAAGVLIGAYTGQYNSGGLQYPTTGKMVCEAGFIAAVANTGI